MTAPVWPNDPSLEPTPPASAAEGVVAADGWWPDVDLAQLRDIVRLNQTKIPIARLTEAVQVAILDIAEELSTWRAEHGAGLPGLAAVPGMMVGGESSYVIRWRRAIAACVAADLGERLLGQSSTAAGHDRAAELLPEADLHRRNVVHAVRLFLGQPRIIAELI
ncbi:MAG: head completion/stabilization protein [Brevundimonas sp.]|nr:head completion/stabilization protein [Brevundimonas sp.]